MQTPVVSFVIPVYKKSSDTFRRCLRSLFDQSLRQIEVICVFDGEDKDLQSVAGEFKKAKQVVIEHGGASKARNAGFELATGTYVVAWDADCYIKPDAAKRWVDEFNATDADFVYTGYELTSEQGEFPSESFDRYSLECGNYICSMSPIKREKALKWDESLTAAQDWDYWLTATEKGLKGVFVEGSAFVTEAPDSTSVSQSGLSGPNRDEIITAIRAKHGIPDREIGVFSTFYRDMGIKMAKVLNADWIKPQGYTPTRYKTLFNLGYGYMSRFDGIADDVTKIQYWLPGEIEGLQTRSFSVVNQVVKNSKRIINLCATDYEKNKLGDYGIEAEVVPLPLSEEDFAKLSKELPKDFTVLLATDEAYSKLFKDLAIDLPHINFKFNAGKIEDVSCYMAFYQFAALDRAMLTAHVNGRNVISNVQAPYCGFVDPDQTWEMFKKEIYEKLRELRTKPLNTESQEFYLEIADPKRFVDRIQAYSRKVEVIA